MKTMQSNHKLIVQQSTPARTAAARSPGLAGVLALALLLLGGAGCQTSPFATNTGQALASITIANRPLPAVALATDTVFLSHGFTGGRTGANEFTFNHAGSRTVQLAQGGWLEKADERVVLKLTPYGDTVTITCHAQWVENAGEPGVAPHQNTRSYNAQPYQDLLDEINANLQ